MRIGLLIYGSLEMISGGFIYDRTLVRHLRGQGDRVEVISLPWRSYGRGLLDNLSPGLFRSLREAPLDLLLQDELVHPSCFWLNRRLQGRVPYPIISLVHHLRSSEARPSWESQLYREVERQYLASVAGFVFISRTTRADVERLVGTGRPGVVAYPGGDRLPGALTPDRIAARSRAPGPLRIISVANLIPRKEVHTLVAALAGLPREGWRLTVAGSLSADPGYARAVRGQVDQAGLSAQVDLLGTLADQDLAGHLAESHVLAVPSSYEGLGIVYLEGMRFGLPAVASNAGAAREIISPGEDGFLVPPGDAAALARCLGLLMEDRELLMRLSLQARQRSATHPTWSESVALVHRFLHRFEA